MVASRLAMAIELTLFFSHVYLNCLVCLCHLDPGISPSSREDNRIDWNYRNDLVPNQKHLGREVL
jgi:hypothetical protein